MPKEKGQCKVEYTLRFEFESQQWAKKLGYSPTSMALAWPMEKGGLSQKRKYQVSKQKGAQRYEKVLDFAMLHWNRRSSTTGSPEKVTNEAK